MGQAILLDIVEEHLEEADFLWSHRQSALADRDSTLHRLAELEERLLAHLDGLVLSEEAGWELLSPKLIEGETGEAFAAAWVALASGRSQYVDALRAALNTAKGPVLAGIGQAFCHAPNQQVVPLLTPMLSADGAAQRAVALDALSFRRSTIPDRQLQAALLDKEPLVSAAALTAVGRLRKKSLVASVEKLLEAEQPSVRQEAMRAGLLVGSGKALAHCRAAVKGKTEEASDALTLLGLMGQADHTRLLGEALNELVIVRQAMSSLGWLGYSAGIDELVPLAGDRKLARLVGDTVSRITGVDLATEGFVLKDSPSAVVPQEESDEEAYVDDPDDGLPWPDPVKLSTWWKANGARFNAGTRYRNGRPHTRQMLVETLQQGNLADRHQAAFELALLDPTGPLVETRAFADRQRQLCADLRR
jgi:uncharacterized protein (TIGR02270 family)